MNFETIQKVNFTSKFSDFEVINSEFTKCRCYALASGDNANGSDITDNAIDKAIARNEFYNKPIVAHLYRDPNNSDVWRVGGHDSKVIISDEGIEFINECVPFGTIPESANIHKERVLEPDGVTYNTYLVMDIILWTGRYNIMDAAYDGDIYFNESCEISVNEYHYKDNGIFAIDDFTFSALCLLNKSDNKEDNVLPCFPSCRVEKIHSFSLNETKFKQNFELMLEKLKSYDTGDKSVQDNNNFKKEDKTVMDKTRLIEALATFTYENALGETVGKYAVIDIAENSVGLIDRQDNKAYSINFVETDGEIVFDFDNAVECSFTTKEKAEDDFNYAKEITMASEVSAKAKENEFPERIAVQMQKELEKFTTQIDEMTNAYNELKKQYDLSAEKLAQYEAADAKRKAEEHKAEVEALYEEFAKKINRVPEFLVYRADEKNIEKDIETIKAELTVIAGKAAMSKSQAFSYTPTVSGIKEFKESNELAYTDRYGNLFAKFMK